MSRTYVYRKLNLSWAAGLGTIVDDNEESEYIVNKLITFVQNAHRF